MPQQTALEGGNPQPPVPAKGALQFCWRKPAREETRRFGLPREP